MTLVWQLLRGYGGDERDGGWLRKHPGAKVVAQEYLGKGWRQVMRAPDGEERTYLTDANGNVIEVLR